jgi:phenylpyruvate tautomerase PptA (4-oxalocrotonate tautomerase family)
MPSILIEVRRRYSDGEARALIDAVHAALMGAFKTPEWDRNIRLVEHSPERFACSSRIAAPERYVQITMDCFPGRSLDAKRALYRGIVDRLGPLGIAADCIQTVLREVPRENWGIRGGQAAIDVDMGFNVNV